MTKNQPAFPSTETHPLMGSRVTEGMSLLDWFAGQALSGMVSSPAWDEASWGTIAAEAYSVATEMMKVRDEREHAHEEFES